MSWLATLTCAVLVCLQAVCICAFTDLPLQADNTVRAHAVTLGWSLPGRSPTRVKLWKVFGNSAHWVQAHGLCYMNPALQGNCLQGCV